MTSIYKIQELKEPTFFQKLFHTSPKENFLIELENHLSTNESNLLNITKESTTLLAEKYKVKIESYKSNLEELYDRYLYQSLMDEKLTDEEKNILEHLEDILYISPDYAKKRFKLETENIYRRKFQMIVSDSKIDENEQKELDDLKQNLNIDNTTEQGIKTEETTKKIQPFVDSLIEKRRVSPDDEKQLQKLADDLHVKLSFTDDGLEKLKLFWQIECGELPIIEPDINIQKSEVLYYKTNINWYEERSRTTYTNYGGLTSRVRICKGVYLRAGSIAPSKHTEEYMKLIDSGTIYLTNKRIIFMGSHGNKTITVPKILSYTAYNNGIQIEKDTGKSPFFECNDPELLGMYISRIISDY